MNHRCRVRRRTDVSAASLAVRSVMLATAAAVAKVVGACGRAQTYRPAPVGDQSAMSTTASLASYRGRRLDDPSLGAFLHAAGEDPADGGWSPRQLALAALHQRMDLAEARAALAAARAGAVKTGFPPDVSVSGSVGRVSKVDEGRRSPWSVSLIAGLTFETGGTRPARLARARAAILAARLRLDALGWEIAQTAARASTTLLGATRELRDAEAEVVAARGILALLRARYAEGRISVADIAQAESDARAAALASVQARQARRNAGVSLARALALPASEVDRVTVRRYPVGRCDAMPDPAMGSLHAIALQLRFGRFGARAASTTDPVASIVR